MCGIFFSVAVGKTVPPSDTLLTTLERRGPDASRSIDRRVKTREGNELHLNFHSTVLALRGDDVFQQPATNDADESILAWNGEVWERDDVPIETNDTQDVYSALLSVDTKARTLSDMSSADAICRLLTSIAGPFAFVFYHAPTAMLYFARDATGRRSLMYKHSADSFSLSSCSDPVDQDVWQELEPSGMYYIQLSHVGDTVASSRLLVRMELFTWNEQVGSSSLISTPCIRQVIPRLNRTLEPAYGDYSFDRANVGQLRSEIRRSLHLRLRGIPTWKQEHSGMSIKSDPEGHGLPGERVGILFSGGLDCSVLARLAHDVLPLDQAIALLNVAFENPRLVKSGQSRATQYEECPDRKTGRSSLVELQQTCPDRQWLFIAVNITFEEMSSHRDNIISLMKPHDTEMDLSIAMALYFAARGIGSLDTTNDTYTTSAQVLLSGLGADELFGGYVRHENACRRGGLAALVDELQLDIARIGTRNLGRDDRVTGYWAKEMRYPFLDERLVTWVMDLPVWQKCRFGLAGQDEAGSEAVEPAKYLLRLLALELGLHKTALEKKRAIQFGSRSAKMFDRKTKGTESIKAH